MSSIVNDVKNDIYIAEIVDKVEKEEGRLRQPLRQGHSNLVIKENFLLVLRRWNSYTPALMTNSNDSVGGGYFLNWKAKGIVIDPGFQFFENFVNAGLRIADIDAIVLTHSHIDHCADFESLMTLLYEYNDEIDNQGKDKDKKNISILANQGVLRKYSGWLDLLHLRNPKTQIKRIYVLDAFMQDKSHRIDGTLINVMPIKAQHNEIIAEGYAVGLIFELYENESDTTPQFKIGIIGDTGFNPEIQSQYCDCDLIIIHLGSLYRDEIKSGLFHKNHSGALGTTEFLTGCKYQYELAIISEFGEELSQYRRNIMRVFRRHINRNFIVGDIGTKVVFNSQTPHIPKLKCEFVGCSKDANISDVYVLNGIVRHYCSAHTPATIRLSRFP